MKVLLSTLNAKYIHKNLAIRWLYCARTEGHDVSFKEYTIKDDLKCIAQKIKSIHPDLVGLSVYIWNGDYIRELIPLLKQALPQCRIVLGGPEVSYKSEDYFTEDVDAIVLNEGEKTFWQFVDGEKEIHGILTHDYENRQAEMTDIARLEKFESPYLLPQDARDMDKRYLYLEASRGCPFHCAYCMASLDNHVREFSLDYLFKLFDALEKSDVHQVKFLDRTFNANRKRSLAIAERLIAFREDCSFQFEVMADLLDNELIDLFTKARNPSRFRFEVGIQSFNTETLAAVKRQQNLDRLCDNVRKLLKGGCVVHCDLIAGLPYENLESFKQTFQKLFALKCDEMQVGILKLLKGSLLREQTDRYDIVYEERSPYRIVSNRWVCAKDIESVEAVAFATERLYNRDVCRKTLIYLYDKGVFMYDLLEKIGRSVQKLTRPYQPFQVFKLIDETLEDETAKLLLANEYYYRFRQRPVRYRECTLDKERKKASFDVLLKNGLLTQNDSRYAYFDDGFYQNGKAVQILIYNSDQHYPKRYFVSPKGEYLAQEDLNERCYDSYLQ